MATVVWVRRGYRRNESLKINDFTIGNNDFHGFTSNWLGHRLEARDYLPCGAQLLGVHSDAHDRS